MIPSWGVRPSPVRRVRLFALVAVRDGMRHLPGLLANIAPHVDGVVALDDGSRDGSAEFLEGRPEVVELIRNPAERPRWDEVANHRQLVAAALQHGAEWAQCIDHDERVERNFRTRAERVIARGGRLGVTAFSLSVLELWDAPDRYRADGVWGKKTKPTLFRLRADHEFDPRPLHGIKAPLQSRPVRRADLRVYHLGMLTAADREARRARYEQLDPDARWQAIGYAYLTDETGLRLRRVPRRRGYSVRSSEV
ncbi:MAG: hypothetical protein ABI717_00585 [Actinomycetota bacterium]